MWERTADFWRVRDAWEAATIANQKARGYVKRGPPTLDGQRRKWTINAATYLKSRPKVLAQAQGLAVQPPDTSGEAFRLIEALPAALAEQFDQELSSVAFSAFREWPVSSGFSKASLFLTFEPAGSSFIARIGDSAPYAPLIKNRPGPRLIGSPSRAAASTAIARALEVVGG